MLLCGLDLCIAAVIVSVFDFGVLKDGYECELKAIHVSKHYKKTNLLIAFVRCYLRKHRHFTVYKYIPEYYIVACIFVKLLTKYYI